MGAAMAKSVVAHMENVAKNMHLCAQSCGCPSCWSARILAARKSTESIGAKSTVLAAAIMIPVVLGNSIPVNSDNDRQMAITSWIAKKNTANTIVQFTAGAGAGSAFTLVAPGGKYTCTPTITPARPPYNPSRIKYRHAVNMKKLYMLPPDLNSSLSMSHVPVFRGNGLPETHGVNKTKMVLAITPNVKVYMHV
jgi:hypothetical protein